MGTTLTRRPKTQKATPRALTLMLFGIAERGGPLIEGTTLTCPGCESRADILAYSVLEHSEKYADQVVPPLKCRACRHVFALLP